MKVYKFLISLPILTVSILISSNLFGQGFSLNDSTIIFKDKNGKVLSKLEVQEITKGAFSTSKSIDDKKNKVVTLIPLSKNDIAKQDSAKDLFRNSLLNKKMKPFVFKDINGKIFTSNALMGKTVVFNFWFLACEPCIREMPLLNSIVEKFKDSNVIFIAPSFDKKNDIVRFMRSNKFNYHIIPDAKKYALDLGIVIFPLDIILDGNGVVSYVIEGNNDTKTQTELINDISATLNKSMKQKLKKIN